MREEATFRVKAGLAEMLKGGVIMDVTDAAQAHIAEEAGACAVMALERVPADIRAEGGVARMASTTKIGEIQEAVTTSMITPPLSISARPDLTRKVPVSIELRRIPRSSSEPGHGCRGGPGARAPG